MTDFWHFVWMFTITFLWTAVFLNAFRLAGRVLRQNGRLTKYERENSHLGWRVWIWYPRAVSTVDKDGNVLRYTGRLISPNRLTTWMDPELRAQGWSTSAAVRGEMGIHARLPRKDWMKRKHPDFEFAEHGRRHLRAFDRRDFGGDTPIAIVTGLVERHGRYVLGVDGWRAEWVTIKKLRVRTEKLASEIRAVYPDVEVLVVPLRKPVLARLKKWIGEKLP